MKPIIWAAAFLTFLVVPASAQQTNSQQQHTQQAKPAVAPQGDGLGFRPAVDSSPPKARSAVVTACKDLETTGSFVDKLYDEKGNPIFDLVDTTGTHYGPPSADGPDSVWDGLIDCANQTHSGSERAEALRVAAMWEQWRAEWFQKAYRDALPVPAGSCKELDAFDSEVKASLPKASALDSYRFPDSLREIEIPLAKCATESEKLNHGKPTPEFARALKDLWTLNTSRDLSEQNESLVKTSGQVARIEAAHKLAEDRLRKELADPSVLITFVPEDQLDIAELPLVFQHNRNLCDQVVTVAGLTPNGLALYIPPEGQRFMAKNSKNYPRMCLVQDVANLTPGVPRYLLVWAYSENAFAGFQPVQQATTAPVSGSGTVTNLSGEMWHFTYTGTETEINTVEAPYVVQSRSLYLRAYDGRGDLVSQHSITTSNMAGGDASYAAGYNAAALISALWNNPSHLIKSILKDVQKDSMKYASK